MRLRTLTLENFRGFKSLKLTFEPEVTVLVGINGSGKSTILDALAVALSQLATGIRTSPGRGRRFSDADVHKGAPHTRVTLTTEVMGKELEWSIAHVRTGYPREVSSHLSELREVIDRIQASIRDGEAVHLPLAVYYPVNRAVLDIPKRIRERHSFSSLSAYDEALVGGEGNFRRFFEWFREREDLENENKVRRNQPTLFTDPQLNAVRKAIERFMPDFRDLRIERAPQRMLVSKRGETFAVEQLSDGEKCMLALVGDLARRLVLANEGSSSPLDEPAVVLIDEIDLHLHPGWQRDVVGRLRETFPKTQFVLTTHSPQVLSTVPARCVRLLENFEVCDAPAETEGGDSNAILADVMGVSERPAWVEELIGSISRCIDDDDLDGAKRYLAELEGKRSHRDAEFVRLSALVRFLEGASNARDS